MDKFHAEGFHPILVANARVDWLAMDDDDITKKFPILLEGILQDVYSQRAASAWQGAQPQKLTVSVLLPGTSSAAEWRDLLQSRRQFWPTLTTRHASLVPVSAEALQRERRQMQAKHLWYNLDIRWSDLKDKLEVLAPTGLTRDDIWRHLFLTKQRKNPMKRDATLEKTWRMSNGSGKPRNIISRNTKRMAVALLALTWIRQFKALTLTTLQHIRQLKTQKLYMHVDGRQKKECTVSRGKLCLMYVMRLSTMTMQLPLAQMSNREGEAGMETMLWDISVIPNEQDKRYLMLHPGVLHMSALPTFHPFFHLASHLPNTCGVLVFWCWCLGFGVVVALSCFCFLFCKCFGIPNSPRIL